MKSIYKISFSVLICLFIFLFAGQDIAKCSNHETAKTESTANYPNSCASCNSECSSELDVSLFMLSNSDQILYTECNTLLLHAFRLPTSVYYSIWLPPDNS